MKNGSRSFKTGFSDFQESQEVVFCSQEEFQNYKNLKK